VRPLPLVRRLAPAVPLHHRGLSRPRAARRRYPGPDRHHAHGRRHTLLVTRYGTPGETGLDRYLSRVMAQPFAIQGTSEDVDRLVNAPAGTKIAGTFAAYTSGSPSLLIADLTAPAPKS